MNLQQKQTLQLITICLSCMVLILIVLSFSPKIKIYNTVKTQEVFGNPTKQKDLLRIIRKRKVDDLKDLLEETNN